MNPCINAWLIWKDNAGETFSILGENVLRSLGFLIILRKKRHANLFPLQQELASIRLSRILLSLDLWGQLQNHCKSFDQISTLFDQNAPPYKLSQKKISLKKTMDPDGDSIFNEKTWQTIQTLLQLKWPSSKNNQT